MKIWEWRKATELSDLSTTVKCTLYTISNYMDEDCTGAFPSVKTIATGTAVSVRSMYRTLKAGEKAGYLERRKMKIKGKKWLCNYYIGRVPDSITAVKNEVNNDDSDIFATGDNNDFSMGSYDKQTVDSIGDTNVTKETKNLEKPCPPICATSDKHEIFVGDYLSYLMDDTNVIEENKNPEKLRAPICATHDNVSDSDIFATGDNPVNLEGDTHYTSSDLIGDIDGIKVSDNCRVLLDGARPLGNFLNKITDKIKVNDTNVISTNSIGDTSGINKPLNKGKSNSQQVTPVAHYHFINKKLYLLLYKYNKKGNGNLDSNANSTQFIKSYATELNFDTIPYAWIEWSKENFQWTEPETHSAFEGFKKYWTQGKGKGQKRLDWFDVYRKTCESGYTRPRSTGKYKSARQRMLEEDADVFAEITRLGQQMEKERVRQRALQEAEYQRQNEFVYPDYYSQQQETQQEEPVNKPTRDLDKEYKELLQEMKTFKVGK